MIFLLQRLYTNSPSLSRRLLQINGTNVTLGLSLNTVGKRTTTPFPSLVRSVPMASPVGLKISQRGESLLTMKKAPESGHKPPRGKPSQLHNGAQEARKKEGSRRPLGGRRRPLESQNYSINY